MSQTAGIGRIRAVGIVLCVALFVSGMLAGAAIERLRLRAGRVAPPIENAVTPLPPAQVIENMKMAGTGVPLAYEALGLSPEQRERIRQIIDARRPRTDSLLRDRWPPLRALIDSVRRDVEQVLTNAQRARLDSLRRGGLLR